MALTVHIHFYWDTTVMTDQLGRADLHMHTNISDGASDVGTLLQHITNMDLDVIAITDHDRLDASLWAYEHQDQYPFEVVPGLEVTSREGHVLAWWVTEGIPPHLSLEETVQAIREAGGIAVLAHPFHIQVIETLRGFRRYCNDLHLIERAGFDGIEVVNAGTVILGANAIAKFRLSALPLAMIGNSDAHTLNAIGSGSTRFPGRTANDLRNAIINRQTQPQGGVWSPAAYLSYLRGVANGTIVYESASHETQHST
jgi:predicted metal-dependent phosphoesterase TrpH